MENKKEFRFVVVKIYSIPGRGVVVSGRVEKGRVAVGDEVGFLGRDGKNVYALVVAIEVSRNLVEETQAGQEASLLLQGIKKDQLNEGTVLMDVPEAPPAAVAPSTAERPPSQVTLPPVVPSHAEPIQPKSSMWRTVLFIIIALLIFLAILVAQGKWDPRKRFTSAGPSEVRDQLSVVSHPRPATGDGIKFIC